MVLVRFAIVALLLFRQASDAEARGWRRQPSRNRDDSRDDSGNSSEDRPGNTPGPPTSTSTTKTTTTTTTTTTKPTTSTSTTTTTAQSTTMWPNYATANITGPKDVTLDFEEQTYTVSMGCPLNFYCTWMLDDSIVGLAPNTSIRFRFRPDQIGNHTLSYVAVANGVYRPLVSVSVNVRPTNETAVLLNPDPNSIIGLIKTTAGFNSSVAIFSASRNNSYTSVSNAFDCALTTAYVNPGICDYFPTSLSYTCGLSTGFQLTIRPYPALLTAIRFATGSNGTNVDPLTITIEGSNRPTSDLFLGSSWTLIYNGSTGLSNVTARAVFGSTQYLSSNSNWFSSYRVLVTGKRNTGSGIQYGGVELYGYYY